MGASSHENRDDGDAGSTAYIGLGANLGERRRAITRALELLVAEPGIAVTEVSRLRETEPVGILDQPAFLNGVARMETTLGPFHLLDTLLDVERRLGRVRGPERNRPRSIDLDLLLYDDLVVRTAALELPHPRMHERRFVLEPLVEIEHDLVIPGRGRAVDLLARLPRGASSSRES